MRRVFTLALTAALVASLGGYSWSQSGGGGGGSGGSGGAGGAGGSGGASGTVGASGASGTATTGTAGPATTGTAGATGTGTAGVPGTVGSTGAPGSPGASPAGAGAATGIPGNRNAAAGVGTQGVGQGAINANPNARLGVNANNPNAISSTPWFTDPAVRRQLGINNAQFNQLNSAYQQSLQRYNQRLSGLNTRAGVNSRADVNAANRGLANQGVARDTDATGQTSGSAAVGVGTAPGTRNALTDRSMRDGNIGLERNRAADAIAFQNLRGQFDTDFNASVNQTLTDQQMRNRFNQLGLQYRGLSAFNDPTVSRQLNLTGQQQRELRQLAGTFRREAMALRRDARTDPNSVQQQFAALQARYMQQLNGVLTPEQQQMYTGMTGEQFQFPYNAVFPLNESAQIQQNAGSNPIPTAIPQNGAAETQVPQTGAVPQTQPGSTVR